MVAIKGDRKKGYKVIKYLESLSGLNYYEAHGGNENLYYYINDYNYITTCTWGKPGLKYLLDVPETKIYELWT